MEIYNIQWLNYSYTVFSCELIVRYHSHFGIHVYGINSLDIWIFTYNTTYRPKHMAHGFANTLSPMRSNKDKP